MKTMFRISLLFAAVSALVVGCSKNEIEEPANPSRPKVQAELYANVPESRIEIGEIDGTQYPVTWSETGEEVAVIEFAGEADPTTVKSTEYELSGDKKLAHFTYSLDAVAEAATFDYFACYPYGVVCDNPGSKNYVSLDLSCLTSQKVATLGQVDTNCAVIVSSSTGHTEQQTSLDMYFNHVVSYAKMAIKGLEAGEVVESIVFESEAMLANTAYQFSYADGTNSATGTPSKSLAIDIPDSAADAEGKLENVWFVTLPVAEGLSDFTICVETADNTYTKKFSVSNSSKNLKFERGKVSKFTANMSGATKEAKTGEWSLLRNIATLHEGLEVIIAAAGFDKAMAWQDDNNRKSDDITKSAETLTTIGGEVRVFQLQQGSTSGTWAFFDESYDNGEEKPMGGYLYAASDSANHLKTQAENDVNGEWTISLTDGVLSIVAAGSTNRNVMQYNSASNSELFSCYAEASQKPVALYFRKASTEPRILSLTVDNNEIGYEAGSKITVTVKTNKYAEGQTLTLTLTNADGVKVGEGTAQIEDNVASVTITANQANETQEPRELTLTVSLPNGASKSTTISQGIKPAESANATDYIDRAFTGVAATTTYAAWSEKTGASGAIYAGNSAGGNDAVQLRSKNDNSGIVTTKSGGKVKKIVVTWNSNTSAGRTLDIYGKSSAYSAASDLYSTSTQGTKLGSIVKGTSTELTITGDYTYIGMRSNNAAMYITEIQITWETSGGGNSGGDTPATPVLGVNPTTLSFEAAGGEKTVACTIENEVSGQNVTASESVDWLSTSVSGKTVTVTATENTTTSTRTATVTIAYTGAESKTVTVSQAAGEAVEPENPGGGDATPKTVTFTFKNYPKEGTTTTEGNVTFTGSKGTHNSTSARFWTDGLRVYDGNTIKFEVPTGMVITKIDFSNGITDWTGSQQVVEFTGLVKATITSAIVTYQ